MKFEIITRVVAQIKSIFNMFTIEVLCTATPLWPDTDQIHTAFKSQAAFTFIDILFVDDFVFLLQK